LITAIFCCEEPGLDGLFRETLIMGRGFERKEVW